MGMTTTIKRSRMLTISKGRLKATMLEVFREIEKSGQPVIVTDRGKPVLRVEPYRQPTDTNLAFSDLKVVYHEDILLPTESEWSET